MSAILLLPFENTVMAAEKSGVTIARHPESHVASRHGAHGLPVMSDGQMALPSGAYTFHGPWNAAVNPRTGMAAFSITVASLLYDSGKHRRDLMLSYKGTPVPTGPDPFDLGTQWHLNIGTESLSSTEIAGHRTTDIMTGEGHPFTMVSDRDGMGKPVWHPLRYKLKDVVISGKPGNWTLSFASGIREHIQNGYEDWEQFRGGSRLWFYYDHSGKGDKVRHLTCVSTLAPQNAEGKQSDCQQGIRLLWHKNTVEIHGQQFLILEKGNAGATHQLRTITFPSLSSPVAGKHGQKSLMKFSYDLPGNRPWLLRKIHYPTGMSTLFLYNSESNHQSGQMSGLYTGMHGARIPVVTEQVTTPDNRSVPPRHEWFSYSGASGKEHNYTGYQGNHIMIPGKDNLIDRGDNYTYTTTRDNGHARTITTYNKYHLALNIILRDDKSNRLVASGREIYPPWKNTTYEQLPANYSFPLESIRSFYRQSDGDGTHLLPPKKIVEKQMFDKKGQLLWRRDAYGRETFIQYCPDKGDEHCPANTSTADAWPRAHYPEKIAQVTFFRKTANRIRTLQNEADPENSAVSGITEKVFDYVRLASGKWKTSRIRTGNPATRQRTTIRPGGPLPELSPFSTITETRFEYETNPKSESFGMLSSTTMTQREAMDQDTKNRNLFQKVRPPVQSMSLNVTNHLDNEKKTRTIHIENRTGNVGSMVYSLKTGLKLSEDSPEGTIHTQWSYDLWQRPVKKVVSLSKGGKPHVTTWRYMVNQGEMTRIMTDPDGNQSKTVLASDGKVISTWHRFSHGDPDTGWIPDRSFTYTDTGNLASMTVRHAQYRPGEKAGKRISLITTYDYDLLGRKIREHHPEGLIDFTIYDDTDLRVIRYRAASPLSHDKKWKLWPVLQVVDSNILGQPVASYRLPLQPSYRQNRNFLYGSVLRKQLGRLLSGTSSSGMSVEGVLSFVRKSIRSRSFLSEKRMEYDGSARPVELTDASGAVSRWRWKHGVLEATIMPDGRVVHDTFDMRGKKIARCLQPVDERFCHNLGTRGFDSTGNLIWKEDAEGHIIRYTHDASGRILFVRLPPSEPGGNGHVLAWKYNSIGPVSASLDGTPYLKYTYDPKSWRLTDREDNISHQHYRYDRTGQIRAIVSEAPKHFKSVKGISYPVGSRYFVHDEYGALISHTDLAGNRYTSIHDRFGRETGNYVLLPDQTEYTGLSSVSYDRFSRPVRIYNDSGITRIISYDALGKLASTVDYRKGTFFQSFDYYWDPQTGNLVTLARKEGILSSIQHYSYDLQNNLVRMVCHASRHPDKPGALCPRDTMLSGSAYINPLYILEQNYSFDHWNHMKTVTEQLVSDNKQKTKTTKTVRYHYAGDRVGNKPGVIFDPDKLVSIETQWSDLRYQSSPKKITWDALGHMVRDAEGNLLHYNAFGQQDRFVNVYTGDVTHYFYNSQGYQVAEQVFNSKNKMLQKPLYMVYENGNLVEQVQEDGMRHQHVAVELNGLAHSENGRITDWYLHDYKGDAINRIGANGELVSDKVYSPYGMVWDRMDFVDQGLPHALAINAHLPWWQIRYPEFNGQFTDQDTGYQFLGGGYRAYNPGSRTFMGRDEYSPFQTIDGYDFGNHNPIMNTDPSGHLALPLWTNIVSAGIGIGLSITVGILMPVATLAATSSTLFAAGLLVISAGSIAVNVASGSLQIASSLYPSNKDLNISNSALGMVASLGIFSSGLGSTLAGTINVLAKTNRLVNAMIGISGASGMVSSLTSTTAYSMIMEHITSPGRISSSESYRQSIRYLNYLSWVFSVGSMLAGLGAGVAAAEMKYMNPRQEDSGSGFYQTAGVGSRTYARTGVGSSTFARRGSIVSRASIASSVIDYTRETNLQSLRDSQLDAGMGSIMDIDTSTLDEISETDLLHAVVNHAKPDEMGNAIQILYRNNLLDPESLAFLKDSTNPRHSALQMIDGALTIQEGIDFRPIIDQQARFAKELRKYCTSSL